MALEFTLGRQITSSGLRSFHSSSVYARARSYSRSNAVAPRDVKRHKAQRRGED